MNFSISRIFLLAVITISNAAVLLFAVPSHAQIITTIAGTGGNGTTGDGGQAVIAQVAGPTGVATDAGGNLYIASCSGHRIRRVTPGGVISTIAGTGVAGFSGDGGAATAATLNCPAALKFDASGHLFFTDYTNHRVRRISNTGIITTVAGNGVGGFAGDGGAATSASLWNPIGIDVDVNGQLYIGDTGNHRVRFVTSAGVISTLAGTGVAGFSGDNGLATSAQLNLPGVVRAVGAGSSRVVLIADRLNNRIRSVSFAGVISTVVGNGTAAFTGDGGAATSATLNGPYGLALAANGDLYIGEVGNARIRRVSGGIITTVAGNGVVASSGDGGAPMAASIHPSIDLIVDDVGNLIFTEQNFHRVRKIVTNVPNPPLIGTASAGLNSVSVSFSSNGESPVNSYTATCGAVSATSVASPILVSGLPSGQAVTCRVTATNIIGTSVASANSNSVTPTGVPVFTANSPPRYAVHTEATEYRFYASASPAASITWNSGSMPPGTSFGGSGGSNNLIVRFGVGTVGTYTYTMSAANVHGSVFSTHTISVVVQASAPTITSVVRGNGSVTVNFAPPANDGGSPVQWYEVYCGAYSAIVGGNLNSATMTVPDTASGTCVMLAYTAARQSPNSAAVNFPVYNQQTIAFGAAPVLLLTASASVSATGGASGNAVTFSSTTPAICTASGVNGATVTAIGAGTCVIAANQAGNGFYQAATQATQNIIVNVTQAAANHITGRVYHSATKLTDGRVLIVGGENTGGKLTSVEIYNPATNSWAAAAALPVGRTAHTATRLADGRVLVVGDGFSPAPTAAVVYNPVSNTWTATPTLNVARRNGHTATLLNDGRVLVAGGKTLFAAVTSAEVYNPTSNTWTAVASLAATLEFHTAVLLANGEVLVMGGNTAASMERFNPVTNTWTSAGALNAPRSSHSSTMLPTGLILVAGGYHLINGSYLATTELVNPITNAVSVGAVMTGSRSGHQATLLTNGRVLVSGQEGFVNFATDPATMEMYDAASNTWAAAGTLSARRLVHTATSLNDGRVLIAAGTDTQGTYFSYSELFALTALPHAPTIGSANASNASATVTFTPAYHIGLSPLTGFTAISPNGGGIIRTCTTPCTSINVTGLTNGTAYTFTITANNAQGSSSASAPSNSVTPLGTQSITFGSPPSITVGGTGTVTATGGASGQPVVFTSTTTSICTVGGVNGATLTGATFGICTISANQAGNASYSPSAEVTQSFSITAPLTFTVTPSAGVNGTISPATNMVVNSGATTAFTVTPNSGYLTSVGGTCGGSLVGTTFTTNAVVADCSVVASFSLNITLTSVTSRKIHGTAGTFDLPISTTHLISGNIDVEPRTIGTGHTIVFQFNQAVTSIGSVTAVNASSNPIGVASPVINMSNTTEVVVTLTGIADASRVTVTLNGVNGSLSSAVSLGFLVGDVNNNRSVGNTDIAAMKTRIGLNVDSTNFKYDINASGTLTNTDVAAAKTRVGLGI